jgi:L-glyceraldehyde 3-phosphate reductase
MTYLASPDRYETMAYRRTGRSGLDLPAVSLGLWHNFGYDRPYDLGRQMVLRAFDLGVTHFDLANNYGPPPGSAEENFGRMLRQDLAPYRDELIISTKAGYDMWPDIFYSHRFDPNTPLEETMGALASAVRQGKALYVGISSYSAKKTAEATALLRDMGVPCLIHQPSYSMLNRWVEVDLLDTLEREGMGCIVFSPLAQGLLTGKYLGEIPPDARALRGDSFSRWFLTDEVLAKVRALSEIAALRGQSLAQMALAWCLRDTRITSVLIGASSVGQLEENIAALENSTFSEEELSAIDRHATESGINIWKESHLAG